MLFKRSPERQRETLWKSRYAAEGEGLCGVRWQHCLLAGPVGKWDNAHRAPPPARQWPYTQQGT